MDTASWQIQGKAMWNVTRGAQIMVLTFALSLVLHVQVRVAFAFSLQQCAFVFVGLPI